MKKKMFSILLIMLFMISTIDVNSNPDLQQSSPCHIYAQWMGYLAQENGINYWEGYFAGYSQCVEKLYQ